MNLTRRAFVAGSTLSLVSTGLRAQSGDTIKIEGPAFGAQWRVNMPLGIDTNVVISPVTKIIKTVDITMSPFLPASEISLFNHTQTTQPQPMSAGILSTLNEAKRVAHFTQGAFDPTLGGVVGRYGFGPITSAPAGAFRDLTVTHNGLQKSHAAQTLDLCGIAKGFALDQIATALSHLGHRDYFIELGGEVLAKGQHPNGRPWVAGVERPLAGSQALQRTVRLTNEALATSGDQVNSYHHADRAYNHIIDPNTQMPTDSTLASVSVFAPLAITADALATALYALGPSRGPAFARNNKIAALFLVRSRNGLQEMMTHKFAARLIG